VVGWAEETNTGIAWTAGIPLATCSGVAAVATKTLALLSPDAASRDACWGLSAATFVKPAESASAAVKEAKSGVPAGLVGAATVGMAVVENGRRLCNAAAVRLEGDILSG
jgi:hypothetical protein